MTSRTLTLAALGAAVLSASAVPAMAADEQKSTSMSYADLDLSTAAGRAELAQRFDQAARDKCGVTDLKAAKGSAKYCYKTTSEQYRHFAADILRDHDNKKAEDFALR